MTPPTTKVMALIRARSDISQQRFHHHWRVIHSRLGLLLGDLRSYSQNHEVEPSVWGLPRSGFPGIMEAWLDSPEAAQRVLTGRTYLERVQPDEQNWMDLATSRFVMSREYRLTVTGDGTGPSVNAVVLLERRSSCSPEEFEALLSGNVSARLADACPGVQAVAASVFDPRWFPRPDGRYDGLLKVSFDSVASCEADADARRDVLHAAIAEVAEIGSTTSGLFEEYRFRIEGRDFAEAATQPRSTPVA